MEGIIFDLKNFRKNKMNGMSQEEFAKQIGISQDKVSRMEADPIQISLEVLIKIAIHFGMTLDELVKLPKPVLQGVSVEYTWSSVEFFRQTLRDYISNNNWGDTYKADMKELSRLVEKIIRKPKVAFIGRSDVGKSTMINNLLGTARMPAYWTPATAIAVYIKHTKDRPLYMDEDVWIFQSDKKTNEVWDDTRLNDEKYCRSLKLSSGTYELLNSYGTRNGEYFSEGKATSAVVFIDSSLLLNCDIIDLPGYGTGNCVEDDSLSLREKSKADVLVYMSISNNFMKSEDISYVKDAILCLPDISNCNGVDIEPLDNLFIVASQVHVIDQGNVTELNHILSEGCEKFERSLTEDFWEYREKPDLLLSRFYTYTSNIPMLRKRFEEDFCKLIEKLPQVVEQKAKGIMKVWVNSKSQEIQNIINRYQNLLQERERCKVELEEYSRNELRYYSSFQIARQRIIQAIDKYKYESQAEIENYYYSTITVENLISLMEQHNIKKTREDFQIFSSYVFGLLQDKINEILKEKSNNLARDINNFLANFEMNTQILLEICVPSYGNLGGYILNSKENRLLSILGIGVTAVPTSTVAAITTPINLGITLAFIRAIAVFNAFSSNWRKNIANKFVDLCRTEYVLDKLKNDIRDYWINTSNAFQKSTDSLETGWEEHLKILKEQFYSYDVNKINMFKTEAEIMKNFLQNIPY